MKTIIITAVLSMMLSTSAQASDLTGGLGVLMGYSYACENMHPSGKVEFMKEVDRTGLGQSISKDPEFQQRFGEVYDFAQKAGGCGKVKAMIKRNDSYFKFWG
jgi:hypothetical protein